MKGMNMLIPMIISGLQIVFAVFFITLILSLPLSVIVAKCRLSKNPILAKITAVYIYIMRGTPLLLQLMFIFYGLPLIPGVGITLDRYTAIFVAFVLNYTAYFAEIFRGGIESIPKGQYEAGQVLGLSRLFVFRKIVLPQVIKNILPALSNEVITLIKDTSLVYILGVSDILKAAKSVSNTYGSFGAYIVVGGVYLLIVAVLSRILAYVEKRYRYYR